MSEERTTKRGFESDVKVRRIEAGLAGGGRTEPKSAHCHVTGAERSDGEVHLKRAAKGLVYGKSGVMRA